PPEPPVLLRQQALGLLHPDDPLRRDAERARAPLRAQPLQRAAGRGGDPSPPAALHRPADGQAARRLPLRDAARAPPPARHRVVGVALQPGRPAALLSAERRRVGRRALARYGFVPRPL